MNTLIDCCTNAKIIFENFRVIKIECDIYEEKVNYDTNETIEETQYHYDGYVMVLKDGLEVFFPDLLENEINVYGNIKFNKYFYDLKSVTTLSMLPCRTFQQMMGFSKMSFSSGGDEDHYFNNLVRLRSVNKVELYNIDPNHTMGVFTELSNEITDYLGDNDQRSLVPYLKKIDDNCVLLTEGHRYFELNYEFDEHWRYRGNNIVDLEEEDYYVSSDADTESESEDDSDDELEDDDSSFVPSETSE